MYGKGVMAIVPHTDRFRVWQGRMEPNQRTERPAITENRSDVTQFALIILAPLHQISQHESPPGRGLPDFC